MASVAAHAVPFLYFAIAVVIAATHTAACPTPCSCTSDTLNCYKKGVTSLAAALNGVDQYPTIDYLNIGANSIMEIGPRAFQHLPQAKLISLDKNRISSIAVDAFVGLVNLWHLSLRQNQITYLPPGIFADLNNIRGIDISINSITGLPGGVFTGLSHAEDIDLQRNQITSIESNAFACCDRLLRLRLNNNRISLIAENAFSAPEQYRDLVDLCLHSNSLYCCGDMTRLAGLSQEHYCTSPVTCSSPPELRGKTLAQVASSPDVPACAQTTNATSAGDISCPSATSSTSSGAFVGIILGTTIVFLGLVGVFGFLVVTPAVMRRFGVPQLQPEHGQPLDHTEA